MKKHLFDAGEKVAKTNDRMSEKLSRIIRQNGQMNAEVTKQVINDIKKLLIEATKQKEKPEASLEYETIDINLPVERPLALAPIKETVYKDAWDCHLIHWNLRSPRSCPDTLLQFCQKCDGQPTGHGQ